MFEPINLKKSYLDIDMYLSLDSLDKQKQLITMNYALNELTDLDVEMNKYITYLLNKNTKL